MMTLQKTAILLLLSFVTSNCLAQSGKFTLNVSLPANTTGKVYFTYINNAVQNQQDSGLVQQDRISFSGSIAHPNLARLFFNGTEKEIWLEPATISISEDGKITGSAIQKEYEQLDGASNKIRNRWKIVMDTLMAINKRSNFQFQETKDWVLSPYFEEIKETNYGFMNSHPGSYITAWVLRIEGRDMATDTLKSYYDRFPDAVKQSSYGKDVSKQLNDRNIGVPGAIAANFIADDLQGKKLALSQFKGKYILLDFWGSWCLPCRKSHPHLKTLYGKYKQQGFEIIGVAQEYNDDKNAWRKAVTEDQVDWLHVMTTHNPEADIINKYNIVYFPTKILIDKEGVIIGRYGEKDLTELDAKLESIFKR